MYEYRQFCPVKIPDEQERMEALGSLAGEKYKLKKALTGILSEFEPIDQQGPGDWMFENDVDGQTFNIYSSSIINFVNDEQKTIYVMRLNCETIPKQFMKLIKANIKTYFLGMNVKSIKVKNVNFSAFGEFQSEYFNEKMYDAEKILKYLQQNYLKKDAYCLIALTDHGIYNTPSNKSFYQFPQKCNLSEEDQIPDNWWIFGLSSVKDRVGVISYRRFIHPLFSKRFLLLPSLEEDQRTQTKQAEDNTKNSTQKKDEKQFSKLDTEKQLKPFQQKIQDKKNEILLFLQKQNNPLKKPFLDYKPEELKEATNFDEAQIIRNLIKVINHELCHQFGIRHCIYYKCLMNGSSYRNQRFQDMIQKNFFLCPVCLRKLQFNLKFDLLTVYQQIKQLLSEANLEVFKPDLDKASIFIQKITDQYKYIQGK